MHAPTVQRSPFEQNRVELGKTFPGAKTSLQMHWAQGHAEPEVFVYPAQRGEAGVPCCAVAHRGTSGLQTPPLKTSSLGSKRGFPFRCLWQIGIFSTPPRAAVVSECRERLPSMASGSPQNEIAAKTGEGYLLQPPHHP